MLHYQATGQGPLGVLLHGITEDSTAWDPVIGPLATTHRVLALDLRGHGRSPARPPYDMLTLVQDVHATLDAVAPQEPPLIIGHSLGGMVATVYAAMHPVRAVVNVDQSVDLAQMQQMVLSMLPKLRTAQFTDALDTLFSQLEVGALSPAASARLNNLRRYDRDVVLGIWGGDLQQATPGGSPTWPQGCSARSTRPTWHCTAPNRARNTEPGWLRHSRPSPSRHGPAAVTTRTWSIQNSSSPACDASSWTPDRSTTPKPPDHGRPVPLTLLRHADADSPVA